VPYREAVVLCDLQELSYQDAAAVAGCAIGTVRSRLHRGRQLLAAKIRGERHAFRAWPLRQWM
jgi:RNA polymerase sigma-70 factor (ECF subfamily)